MLRESGRGGGTADTSGSNPDAAGREGSTPSPGMKTCTMCKRDLPMDKFRRRNRRGRQERRERCGDCESELERAYRNGQRRIAYLDADPFYEWLVALKGKYGTMEAARRCGISDRHVRRAVAGEHSRVTLDLVDRALVNEGSTMLWELYPDD